MTYKKEIPGWVLGVVIIVTAVVTCWAVLQTGSGFGWPTDQGTKSPTQELSNIFFPGLTALQNTLNGEKAAAPQPVEKPVATQFNAIQIPWIKVGDIPQHPERGVCTSCHFVKDVRGVPIPAILAGARMPHDARGVCTNCHMIPSTASAPASAPIYPQDVATANNAVQVAFVPGQTMSPPRSPGFAPMAPQATEGGWLGIEVTNITQLTASQYQIPLGLPGVVVAEAEPPGSLSGLKAGDVILSINGVPTATLTDFFRATNNGLMGKGSLNVYRKGQQYVMAVDTTVGTTAQTAPQQGAGVAPPEGEWLGLEVAPISSLTATQYNLPSGLAGLIIVEVEAQAAALGIKGGDVLQYINGVPITDMTKFFLATKNGTLNQGAIVLWRKGEQMATMLTQTVMPNPQPLQPWMSGNAASAMLPSNPSACPGAVPGAQAPCAVQGSIPNGGTMQGGQQ